MIAMSTAVYNRYFKRYADIRDDLINEGVLGIIKGEQYFSEQRGSKATFFWVCAKRNMLMYLAKEVRYRNKIASDLIEDVMSFIPDDSVEIVEPYNGAREIDKIRELASCFNKKGKDIANDLLNGISPKELVDKYGVTKQRISQVYVALKEKTIEKYKFDDGYLVERCKNDKKI